MSGPERSSLLPNTYVLSCERSPRGDGDVLDADGRIVLQAEGAPGATPRVVRGERWTVACHGHLYLRDSNSLDLGDALAELVRRLDAKPSSHPADHVGGGLHVLFCFDSRTGTLTAVTDRLNGWPCYYRIDESGVRFSNTPSALGTEPCASACAEFLKFGYLPRAGTLFRDVKRMEFGQALEIRPGAREVRVDCTELSFQLFPERDARQGDPDAAVDRLVDAFDGFFGKIGTERCLAGLSGGYDSRLIAAYLRDKDARLFNFGNPRSGEVRFAERVARAVGLDLEFFTIPVEAVSRHGDRFPCYKMPPTSFEEAHVFELVDAVRRGNPDLYIDGYVGDVILGSCYFSKIGTSPREIWEYVNLSRSHDHDLAGSERYVDLLYTSKRALPDGDLCGLMTAERQEEIRQRILSGVDGIRRFARSHEDLQELMLLAWQGGGVISSGPYAVMGYHKTAVPFVDHAVMDACFGLEKHLRAGDRIYRALWRRRFPDLASIPKNDTGGAATDSDRVYRLKHVAAAFSRRARTTLRNVSGGLLNWAEEYASVSAYVADPENRRYLESLVARVEDGLPEAVARSFVGPARAGTLSPSMLLRLTALVRYTTAG